MPKSLIKQGIFKASGPANVNDDFLILLPGNENPRAGWSEAFKKMAQAGDDKLLDSTVFELESDRKDWKW